MVRTEESNHADNHSDHPLAFGYARPIYAPRQSGILLPFICVFYVSFYYISTFICLFMLKLIIPRECIHYNEI